MEETYLDLKAFRFLQLLNFVFAFVIIYAHKNWHEVGF